MRRVAAGMAVLALGFGYVTVTAAPARAADTFTIPDAALASCVNAALGGHDGNTYSNNDLWGLASLSCDDAGISNLSGLDKAFYLTSLSLAGNQLNSLNGIPAESLESLNISRNHVADLSGLSTFSQLTAMNATGQTLTMSLPINVETALPLVGFGAMMVNIGPVPGNVTIVNGKITGTALGDGAVTFSQSTSGRTFGGTLTVTVSDTVVSIPDPGFAACLDDQFGTLGSVFSESAVTGLAQLDCSNRGITDLTGAEKLTGALSLDFSGNNLGGTTALQPLAGLTGLETLNLAGVGLTGVTALTSLSGVTALNIANNAISDISALGAMNQLVTVDATGQNLTKQIEANTATALGIADRNGVAPVLDLPDGVTFSGGEINAAPGAFDAISFHDAGDPISFSGQLRLEAHLDVTFVDRSLAWCIAGALERDRDTTTFSNLDLLSITDLSCTQRMVGDLNGIQYMSNLASLDLSNNMLAHISELSSLQSLTSLNLSENPIEDLSPIAALPKLQNLYLNDMGLRSIDALDGMDTLKNVSLADNALSEIDAVSTFPALISLDVSGNELTELSGVSSLANLQTLKASDNLIGSLSTLTAANSKLTRLTVSNNRLTSLDGVQRLSRIANLDASSNRISDLSPLATRTRLNFVLVTHNSITSLSPLKNLSSLITVEAGDNSISDVSPLAGKFILSWVQIDHNRVADLSPLSSVATVDARGQDVSLAVVPGTATQVPLKDNASQLPTLTLPSGVSVDAGMLVANAEATYPIGFHSGDFVGTGKEFSGTLTVESAYHAFTAPSPTITGSAQVGATLTADPGTWSPEPEQLDYRWLAGEKEIENAHASSYVLTAAEQGAQIRVEVTGTSEGFTGKTVTSAATNTVLAANFVAPADVTVSGTFAVGETVSVDAGTWTPTPGEIAYQWLRDGASIPLADQASYQLTPADATKKVSVRVTASKEGFAPASVRSAAAVVGLGAMSADQPEISGTAAIGVTLKAVTGSWSPTPASLTVQWYRGGLPIGSATGDEYQVTAEDVGKAITVAQTATAEGYQPLTKVSSPTAEVPSGTLNAPTEIAVEGTYAVGNTVTAEPGDWSPSPDSYTYQWSRDGSQLSASTSSYVLTAADQGHEVTVRVTAHKAGYTDAWADSASAVIAKGTLVGSQPTVTGSATYGRVLKATSSTWSPVANLSWQWLRDGEPISGATGSNYALTVDDIGTSIQAQVTASLSGYTSEVQTSQASSPVAEATLVGPDSVTVTGELAVGKTLSLEPVSWTPTPDKVSYQWLRGGAAIIGATGSSYTLTSADLNQHITANVIARRDGYTMVSLTSVEQDAVAASAFSTEVPAVSGNAVVGQQLSATSGVWTPTAATLSYQWLADGNPIGLATSNTYQVSPAVLGKAISVQVTGTLGGYAEKTIESSATAAVAAAAMSGPATATVTGTFQVGHTVTADAGTWTPTADQVSYQWLRGGKPITNATQADYSLVAADADKVVTVQITLTKEGFSREVIRSEAADPVARASFAAATPLIDGEAALGHTLTATVGTWSPTPSTTGIQWLRDGVAIDGATTGTYVLAVADVGKVISVAVTGSADGYAAHTAPSIGTDPVAAGTFTAPASLSVTGEHNVGKTLAVDSGTWTPTPTEFSYQWLRDGDPITDAVTSAYALVPEDETARITVSVTAKRPGHTDAHLESTSANPVGKGTIVTEKPTISGQGQVSGTLTAKPGTWSPAPATWTYQWLRDGAAIDNETNATYAVVGTDIGANISVKVSGSRKGYATTAEVESDPVEVSPQGSFVVPDDIAVEGDFVIGGTLTAKAGDWMPTPGAVHYQWLRAGKVIPGATDVSYVLDPADLGAVVTVKVTASKDGYRSASARSQAPVAVASATFVAPNPRILGSVALGAVLTADAGTWSTTPTLAYQWYRAGIAVSGATKITYTVGVADVGKRLTVKVTGTKAGYDPAIRTSTATATVQPGKISGPRPVLSGKAKVKSTLQVRIGRWTPSPITVSYKWYRNGSAIKGATSSKYRLTAKDRGKRIGVRVTYSKPGYLTQTRWVKSSKQVK